MQSTRFKNAIGSSFYKNLNDSKINPGYSGWLYILVQVIFKNRI